MKLRQILLIVVVAVIILTVMAYDMVRAEKNGFWPSWYLW